MVNRLAKESSPYLLQHKDNPVDWYPWGEEAFARARAEDKPIFLSIGYSTCHWCHVMEHESFEKDEVAGALSRGFVAIKVDREERPDVDDIYMQAVQLMTGQGGWPLSLFLTPDRKPFYGGTYFPPTPRWGKPGFPQLLEAIGTAWKERREELESSAAEMIAHLETGAGAAAASAGAEAPGPELIASSVRVLERQFDEAEGGFGGAPKFPPAMRLELLLRHWLRTGDASARAMTEKTLAKMAAGGMYDQVGGGFHRYSVDARWLVPHFEKMLYDNAMLARVYLQAFRAFGNPDDARVARETLDYLLREMTPDEGGFFAAQDADSGGEEGTFYVWNPASLAAAVGAEAAPVVAARFGVTARGNFEDGETVLSVVRSLPELAADFGKPEKEIIEILAGARRKMYDVRSRRVAPATDDKLLTDWTALAISAFALAARVLDEPRYEQAARAAADRILDRCVRDGRLLHREKAGKADIPGFATDYAYLDRGAPRPLRSDLRAALLHRGRAPPGDLRRHVRRSARRLLPLRAGARRPDPPAQGELGCRDALLELGGGDEPAAAVRLHGRRAVPGTLRRHLRGPRRPARPRRDRLSAPALRARLPVRPAARDRPRGRAGPGGLRGPAPRGLREPALRTASSRTPNPPPASPGSPPSPRGAREATAAAAYVCTAFACQAPVSDPEALRRALDRR